MAPQSTALSSTLPPTCREHSHILHPQDLHLDAGIHTLTVDFTPDDTATYENTSATVDLIVDKLTPSITWSDPASITYGTALDATQLNATADVVPEPLVYFPTEGTILDAGTDHALQVSIPESENYTAGSATVYIDVNPAPLTITANDAERTAGTSNPIFTATYTGFMNGDAAIDTPPVLATIADETSVPGDYPITVTSAADNNYSITEVSGTLDVTAKQTPSINWPTPANISYGTTLDSTQLNATSSVSGAFTYSPRHRLDARRGHPFSNRKLCP